MYLGWGLRAIMDRSRCGCQGGEEGVGIEMCPTRSAGREESTRGPVGTEGQTQAGEGLPGTVVTGTAPGGAEGTLSGKVRT